MTVNTFMRRSFSSILESVARWLTYGLIFLLPLATIPTALDPLEIHKQTILVALTLCAFLAWSCSMIARRGVTVRTGWIHAVPLFVLGATIASATASPAPFLSWIGGSGQEYMSVLTVFALTILYFVVVNVLGTEREHRVVHALLVSSAAIAGGIGVWSSTHGGTFNTVGPLVALGVYMAALASFGCGLLVANRPDHAVLHGGWLGRAERALIVVVSFETLVLLAAVNYRVLWILLFVGVFVPFATSFFRAKEIHDQRAFLLPMFLLVASAAMSLGLRLPIGATIPMEVTMSHASSVTIARTVLEGPSALLGSGPGTYAFDYALLHDPAVNATPMWAKRFDRASSFAATVATSLGLLGLCAWALFFLAFFLQAVTRIVVAKTYKGWATVLVDFSAWLGFAVAAFLYPGNVTFVFFLFVLAALMTSQADLKTRTRSFATSPGLGRLFAVATVLAR